MTTKTSFWQPTTSPAGARRAAQLSTLALISTATPVVVILVVLVGIHLGLPLLAAIVLASSWPLVSSIWLDFTGRRPRRHLGLPGWVWLFVAGVLLGAAIAV